MSRADPQSLRIGCVQYLNAQPLIFGWPGPVLLDHPTALCRKLAQAELDVALVSSFEYLREPVYAIVDGVCVAADGAVQSVFVAHREPIEQLNEIALDPASQTSVNLLRCLLAERGLNPKLTAATSAETAIGEQRGALMIGDQALKYRGRHGGLRFWDLAAAWKESSGLPFVFALWLIRPEVRNAAGVAARLRKRCAENLRALERVIAAQADFSPEFCAFYFRDCLRFRFAEAEKAGLLHFRTLCQKHGILPVSAAQLSVV